MARDHLDSVLWSLEQPEFDEVSRAAKVFVEHAIIGSQALPTISESDDKRLLGRRLFDDARANVFPTGDGANRLSSACWSRLHDERQAFARRPRCRDLLVINNSPAH